MKINLFFKKLLVFFITFNLVTVPFLGQLSCIVYADAPSPTMSESDMVDAFRAYCASRDLTIDGSLTDAVTSFTTDTYNRLVRFVGLDPTQLQAEISKVYDNQGVFSHYVFTALGINGFNRIFAQLLQDNELQVGDTNVNKLVYSGESYTDNEGNTCLVWTVWAQNGVLEHSTSGAKIKSIGTYLVYNSNNLSSLYLSGNYPVVYNGIGKPVTIGNFTAGGDSGLYNYNVKFTASLNSTYSNVYKQTQATYQNGVWISSGLTAPCTGGLAVVKYYRFDGAGEPIYYLCGLSHNYYNFYWGQTQLSACILLENLSDITTDDTDIYYKTPPNEDIKEPYPDDEPVDIYPDGGNEPGGDDNPGGDPGGTDPGWTLPDGNVTPDGDGGFDIDWNFNLPDLNIDWSINGLMEKFPFSIPRDIYLLCNTLSADPQAPEINGTIDLKIYTWVIDWDLQQFDNVARILRAMEVILFLIGLIMITRTIIKG